MKRRGRSLAIAAAALLSAAGANLAAAFAETAPGAPQTAARDLMIQNVCLDAAGAVLPGVSPIDGDPGCAAQRDLRPAEALPYHKHDHPSPGERTGAPLGYQRHDSFPVETASFGVVVEHSFDFGAGEGRRFGVFDRGSDGGDIAILSPGAISLGATEDGGGGFGLWVGECRGRLTAAALARSWLIAEFDPELRAPLSGDTVARLNAVRSGYDSCPARFNAAYTSWRMAPFRYRAGPDQGQPVALQTLISEHYGGASPDTADAVERFYFTRELGGTRWEAWQNARGNAAFSAARIAERAASFAATGRCSAAEKPAGAAPLLLVDCREWTLIAPAADPRGDPPGFFIDAIRARPDSPRFFAGPAAGR